MKKIILAIIILGLSTTMTTWTHAQPKWYYLALEQSPVYDANGRPTNKPANAYPKDKKERLTGGEWIIPADFDKGKKSQERYQRMEKLLILIDTKTTVKPVTEEEARKIRETFFGIKDNPRTGVTTP